MKNKGFATELLARSTTQKPPVHLVSPAQTAVDQITVTIILIGGQEYTVTFASDNPLLQDLCEILIAGATSSVKRLLQIPLKNGKAMLAFSSDRLVGLVTEPPLKIQQSAKHQPSQHSGDPLISEYFRIKNFLSVEDHQRLSAYVAQHEADFVSTTTSTQKQNYRQSLILHSFPEFAQLITQKVEAYLPKVLKIFGIQPFPPSQIEAQLTAHNDGHYYKVHNDNGSSDVAKRELTYVYYFNREPKAYTGGELVIYDSKVQNGRYIKADTFKVVKPENNSIVFFLSRYMHEVRPIQCPSQAFADSRFTINGWVRR